MGSVFAGAKILEATLRRVFGIRGLLILSSLAFLPSFRGSPFVPSYLPCFLSCFLFFSFLPSFLPSFPPSSLPSFLSPGIPSFLPCGVLFLFLLIFLPSFLAPFFLLPPFLPFFLRHSFLPCLRRDRVPAKKRINQKKTKKYTLHFFNRSSFALLETRFVQQIETSS